MLTRETQEICNVDVHAKVILRIVHPVKEVEMLFALPIIDINVFHLIDYLKIKAGYGEIGNGNAAPSVNQILFQNGATYPFGSPEIIYPGSFVPYAVDPDLTWETTKEFGGGIEFRMLKQRLVGTLEFYRKLTDNVILPVKLPTVLSPGDVYLNAGTVENKGIEATFSWNDKLGDEFNYRAGVNFAVNSNAIK